MPSNFIITLAAGTKLTCAQAAGSLLTHKRRWEVRSVGNGSKGELVVRLGLPPVRPDRPPPPDPGMIPLTIPKIKRLLNARTARRCPGGSLSHWDAWTRLLSFCDDADLRDADPDTLRYRVWHIPARLARHARERILRISPRLALERRVPHLLAAAVRPASTRLTGTNHHGNAKGEPSRRRRSRCAPGTPGTTARPSPTAKRTPDPKPSTRTISNQTSEALND